MTTNFSGPLMFLGTAPVNSRYDHDKVQAAIKSDAMRNRAISIAKLADGLHEWAAAEREWSAA